MPQPPATGLQAARGTRKPSPLRWLVGVALPAAALIAAVLFVRSPGDRQFRPRADEDMGQADLQLSGATITRFEDNGAPAYELRSPLIRRFDDAGLTSLESPDRTLYQEAGPPWRITARHGTITGGEQGGEDVLLEEDVRMIRNYPDGRRFMLQTPAINIYPDREYARTSRDVMITTHAGRTRAVGLQGDLDQGLLELYSTDEQRVHTVILPDQFK